MSEYSIAVYIRLSLADEETGKSKAESDSIVNQRSLINRFLDKHPMLSQCSRTEFCDDGFTGTNTERPAFADMMAKVKRGQYNLLIVKDFSRYSRDYIEIGDCLECLFPFLGVRFISINDNYDSDDYIGTTGGLDVVMRNIVYAAYSKDLSVKTTTAKIQLMKQGKYVGGYAPYGYVLHPTIRNKLKLDPDAAKIVRRIFELAVGGMGLPDIARKLNSDKIPTPGQYFRIKHPESKKFGHMSDKISWTGAAVYDIATKLTYTGATVGHVRKITAMLSRKTKAQPPEDWIVVEGMHEAIVTREEFDKAQETVSKVQKVKYIPEMYPLRSLVRCGNCGRAMTRRKAHYFYCPYGRTAPESGCDSHNTYSETELEKTIFNAIATVMQVIDTRAKPSNETLLKKKSAIQESMDLLSMTQKQIEKLRKQKLKLYEQYTSDDISRDVYIHGKADIDAKISEAENVVKETETHIAELESFTDSAPSPIEKTCNIFKSETALTYELAHAFVDAIYVYPDGRREIEWKFKDFCDCLNDTAAD